MTISAPASNPLTSADSRLTPFQPILPAKPGERVWWGELHGSSFGLVITAAAQRHRGPVVVIMADVSAASRLEYELKFYIAKRDTLPVLTFPDWETLPYDSFSPHQDIISQRLATLYQLPSLQRGILIVPASTLMHRLPPRAWLEGSSLMLDVGEKLDMDQFRKRLEAAGYHCVSQVMEHGEFAVRGSLIDLYPMGCPQPFRIDLFDNEIDSIRIFDAETQRSLDSVKQIRLMPAREFALDKEAITRFRQAWRASFEGDPQRTVIYRDVSNGLAPPGIEYYLPLFFEHTGTLFDYLPAQSLLIATEGMEQAATDFWNAAGERYEQYRYNTERPLLPPARVFLQAGEVLGATHDFPRVMLQHTAVDARAGAYNHATLPTPSLTLAPRAPQPAAALLEFVTNFPGRVLFAAETAGRRETLLELLKGIHLHPAAFDNWQAFVETEARLGITVAPLEHGLLIDTPPIAVIAEPQIFGEQAMQRRLRKTRGRDVDALVRNLAELDIGAPVVHEEHGVGRYLGLQTLNVGDIETEFLTLEYAGGDKLYVPVSSLHLISRYSGAAAENAPLHRLGGEQWQRAKRKAAEQVRDVAAELLDIYARRAARKGHAFPPPDEQYTAFTAGFPFEETPDQQAAIQDVIINMTSGQPMDRLVCGDVGFGKTEVAMRAVFMAVHGGAQVAVLVPTTLLAQQHYQNFKDRFADWPVRIEVLSRFRSKKEQEAALEGIAEGKVDIIIGTHKLIQDNVKFKNLGLVVIDEEHRFGVRQKERFKALRAEVDVLTLTATPIPRTLNMALSGMRDLSVIATPPARRLAVKTFVREWNKALIQEACLREIKRGGQVYFLHNEVETIEKVAREVEELVPEARVRIAHGQMRERELEHVMLDFYHQRFNILVCTTIIETGIDVPSANTIIINRADKFGLAQLHQLRGRVGRSYHRAYAYLVIPPRGVMTADAVKRLEAIESLEELGAGFTLATHDLEIRGAGELLGEEQSGQMQEVGFSLYTDLLERAVKALKSGKQPNLDQPLDTHAEIDLHIPALIPEDYLPDVHARLVMYKRIANAASDEELRELQVEMIDRFGLLPEQVKNLFQVTRLKLKARPLGIRKIEAGPAGGRILFNAQPDIDPRTIIHLIQTQPRAYKLDGQDRLRFTLAMADSAARIQGVEQVLEKLGEKYGV
ncbi:MAG: transcription-repair coupling factor [Gammaproteobacteria bacterium]|nr:transcription-repair coupling factor [Gammaproteobacteria bacterium]